MLSGAGAWLSAPPDPTVGHLLPSAHWQVLAARRLGMPLHAPAASCSLCGTPFDRCGDHALACSLGGDRVRRHHRLRDTVAAIADEAGHSPETEKPDLLPPDPDPLPVPAGRRGNPGRRPADIWRLADVRTGQ